MTNPFNETLIILMLTMVIEILIGKLVSRATASAMTIHSPAAYARMIVHVNRLDAIRNLVISEDIRWKHG